EAELDAATRAAVVRGRAQPRRVGLPAKISPRRWAEPLVRWPVLTAEDDVSAPCETCALEAEIHQDFTMSAATTAATPGAHKLGVAWPEILAVSTWLVRAAPSRQSFGVPGAAAGIWRARRHRPYRLRGGRVSSWIGITFTSLSLRSYA